MAQPAPNAWRRAGPWVALILLGGASPLVFQKAFLQGTLFYTFLWAALATGWSILGGYAGQLSLGHSAFFGIGAYTSVLLAIHFGISPWLGMLAGVAITALLGALLGVICFRLKGPFFALATLALGELAFIAAINWRSVTNGNEGLTVPVQFGFAWMGFRGKVPYVYMALGFLLLALAVSYLIKRSRLGYFLAAYREDDAAAQALGVNTYRARIIASAISSGLMAIGGTLYAYYVYFIEPHSVLAVTVSIQIPLLALIGGANSVFGPTLGALLIRPLAELLRINLGSHLAGLHELVYGFVLIVVLLFMPEGLIAQVQRLAGRAWAPRRGRDLTL